MIHIWCKYMEPVFVSAIVDMFWWFILFQTSQCAPPVWLFLRCHPHLSHPWVRSRWRVIQGVDHQGKIFRKDFCQVRLEAAARIWGIKTRLTNNLYCTDIFWIFHKHWITVTRSMLSTETSNQKICLLDKGTISKSPTLGGLYMLPLHDEPPFVEP